MLRSTTLCWNSAHVATKRFRNASVSRIGIRYTRCCSIQTRLYQPHLRWAWSKTQRAILPRRDADADAEAATSDPQHCWRRVCLPARQCASTSCSWHSRASVLWDTPVHQSWHVASQQTSPQPGRLPRLGHAARAHVSSTNPRYGRVAEASCCDMGWISAQRGGLCSWSVAKKDWKHVSVQKVVTLNTCSDVACMTFQFPHITTGSFQSQQCLEERNITFSRMKKFCILQDSAVTFFRCGGKGVTVCFLLR